MYHSFDFSSFLLRLLFALPLVFGTWNPTGWSYLGWLIGDQGLRLEPLVVIVGLVLLIGWVIYLRATFMSLGWLGVLLGAALFAAVIWLFVDLGWLSLENPGVISWLVLSLLSLLLAVGISWSHIRRRLTGQLDVDEIES